MKIFKVDCRSDCGSYFGAYLQSVTVKAESKEEAIAIVKKECKGDLVTKDLECKLLWESSVGGKIIEEYYDSDY